MAHINTMAVCLSLLFSLGCGSSPPPYPLVHDGIQLFAEMPKEHQQSSGRGKLLVAESQEIVEFMLSAPGDGYCAIWMIFDEDMETRVSDLMRNKEVKEWILVIPHQEPIKFKFGVGDASRGDFGILGIDRLKKDRFSQIVKMLQENKPAEQADDGVRDK